MEFWWYLPLTQLGYNRSLTTLNKNNKPIIYFLTLLIELLASFQSKSNQLIFKIENQVIKKYDEKKIKMSRRYMKKYTKQAFV